MLRRPPNSPLFPYPTLFRSVEAAAPAAVRHARKVIAAYRGRQRNVAVGFGSDEIGRCAERVEFRRTQGLDNLRTSFRGAAAVQDRKSTRLNSSHDQISYAVF